MIFASLNCSRTPTTDGLEQMTVTGVPHPIMYRGGSSSSDIDLSSESSLSPVATTVIRRPDSSVITSSSSESIARCNDIVDIDDVDSTRPTRISFTIDSILGRRGSEKPQPPPPRVSITHPESCSSSSYKSMATSLPDLILPAESSSMRSYMERFGRPMPHHHHFIGASPWPYHFLPYLSRPVLTSAYQAAAYSPSIGCSIQLDPSRCSKNSSLSIDTDKLNKGSSLASYSDSVGGRVKRVRTVFTQRQIERLEREFSKQHYMIGPERYCLARQLNLNESQVKVWFQNRRIKWRKQQPQQRSSSSSRGNHTAAASNNPAATGGPHPIMSKLDMMQRYSSEQQQQHQQQIIFHRA